MTVGELKEALSKVNDDVILRDSEGFEFSHVIIFVGDSKEVWLSVE